MDFLCSSVMKRGWLLFFLFWGIIGCRETRQQVEDSQTYPEIYPDYRFITVPPNIAPLNFKVKDAERIEVEFSVGEEILLQCWGEEKIDIPLKKWKRILSHAKGKGLEVKVFIRQNKQWKGYRPFQINVAADSIDPYVAYRLIEPGYELGNRLNLLQREVSTFKEEVFVHHELVGNNCVNCHAFCNYSPDCFMFHVRETYGGTIVFKDGNLQKINTKTPRTITAGAYRMWHPSGNYIAFSNNKTSQAFHAFQEKKIEVYDLESDLMIYDVRHNRVLTDSRFTTKDLWETFPAWSPDGKFLYFCRAEAKKMPMEYRDLKYGIYRLAFDERTGKWGKHIDTIVDPRITRKSAVFPAISPDGKYLLYTESDAGTFPIYHKESDLKMLDLQTGKEMDVETLNSEFTESYHVWSSSGRWIMFSSRRLDGQYTNVYFAYFDKEGRVYKPFLLPQKDPDFYRLNLKSFNIPEFIKGRITVSPYELSKVIKGKALNAQ